MATTTNTNIINQLSAGKFICTDHNVENRAGDVVAATWQLVGFDKSTGKLVGYTYKLAKEDFNMAYEPMFRNLVINSRKTAPHSCIAKAQWVQGKTPAQCVADALNALPKQKHHFVAYSATVVHTHDQKGAIADVYYIVAGDTFYVQSIY